MPHPKKRSSVPLYECTRAKCVRVSVCVREREREREKEREREIESEREREQKKNLTLCNISGHIFRGAYAGDWRDDHMPPLLRYL